MAGDKPEQDGADERRPARREVDDIRSFDNRRQKPKTVTRSPADKMLRPGLTRGYETK